MKYKVGDKVVVRSDLTMWGDYGADSVVEDMLVHRGEEVTIAAIEGEKYKIKCDHKWHWTDEMFENAEVTKADDDPNAVIKRTIIEVKNGVLGVQHTTNSKRNRVGFIRHKIVIGHIKFDEIDAYIELLNKLKDEAFKTTVVK